MYLFIKLFKFILAWFAKSPVFYPHYTWVIVVVIVLANMVGSSIRMAFGVLINPIEINFNWER